MKEPIILIGGGGHCISAIDVIVQTNQYEILGIIDLPQNVDKKILHYPIIGTDDQIKDFSKKCPNFLITVGQIKSSGTRERLFHEVKNAKGNLPVIISPMAYVSKYATIEEGSIIMHHSLVNANARIGKCCIINSKALIEHEAIVGEFCHISTGSIINGQVQVGDHCFIGSNTIVSNNININKDSIIAAGSQVLKTIENSGTYIGNPLRRIR